jgi:hypothetical protein
MDIEGTPLRVHQISVLDREKREENMRKHASDLVRSSDVRHGNEKNPTKISILRNGTFETVLCRRDGTIYHPNTGKSVRLQEEEGTRSKKNVRAFR